MGKKKTIDEAIAEERASVKPEELSEEAAAFKWVCKYVLPFVNAASDAESLRVFCLAYAELRLNFRAENTRPENIEKLVQSISAKLKEESSMTELKTLREFLDELLCVCLTPTQVMSRSEDEARKIEDWIEAVLTTSMLRAEWRGFGNCIVLSYPTKLGCLAAYEYSAVKSITTCFSSLICDNIREISPWIEKIGVCPNCNVFFEKKRKDQEYCSKRCRDNTQMRQYMRKRRAKQAME